MNFKVYIIGEKIESFYSDAIKEYEKRLGAYCKIQLIQLKNTEQDLKKISTKSYKIGLTTKQKTMSSEGFAEKINTFAVSGNSDIAFIICNNNLEYDEEFTLSPMDMCIGLNTTILFEQIYRAYRIINNQPYHK